MDRLSLDPLHAINLKERTVKVPLVIDHSPQVVEVKATGTTNNPSFEITGTNDEGLFKIREIFQWDTNLGKINDHFQQTALRSLFQEHYGTALALDFAPFNSLIKCIIHQQLNLSFALTLTERFVKTYGYEIDGVWFYPTPETVASLSVENLRSLQFSGRKAEYVIGVAEKVANGEIDLNKMRNLTNQEISDILIKLRGVGAWTIQNFLMFALGRPNLFPIADIGIQNALKKLFHLDKKPSKEEMEQMIQGWEPYLSYASLYLWRSVENGGKVKNAKRADS